MIRTLLFSAIVFFLADSVKAQQANYGVKLGANIGAIIGPFVEGGEGGAVIGPHAGFFMLRKVNDRWSVRPELVYTYTGVKFSQSLFRENDWQTIEIKNDEGEVTGTFEAPIDYYADAEGSIKLHYIDFPINFIYHFNDRWGLSFGPRMAYLLKGTFDGYADVSLGSLEHPVSQFIEPFDESDLLNIVDIGFTAGMQYQLAQKMAFNLNMSTGVTSINDVGQVLEDEYFNIFLNTSFSYTLF